MANNTGQIVLIGAIGLAAVYLLTRRQPSSPAPYPYQQYPTQYPTQSTTQSQTQQLLQWAQTQASGSTIANVITGLDWQGIADLWGKIFGSSGTSNTYSGGGTDTPYNPYPEYNPYDTGGEIWV